MNLYEARKNKAFKIVSVPNNELLKNLGIHQNREVIIQNRYAFGGPILLRVQNAYSVAIGKDIAKQISIKEAAV